MSGINGGSIPLGATFAPSGGTATTISSLGGDSSSSGIKFLVEDSAAYAERSIIQVSTVEASVNSGYPGGMTPNKRRTSYKISRQLADGSYFTDQVNIEIIAHPETTVSEITGLRSAGCNMLNDSDFDGLWNYGSRS
jgi:hypothetical protein